MDTLFFVENMKLDIILEVVGARNITNQLYFVQNQENKFSRRTCPYIFKRAFIYYYVVHIMQSYFQRFCCRSTSFNE